MGEGEGGAGALTPERTYRIELRPAARRALAGLAREPQERIRRAIDALTAMPRPAGIVKMHGSEGYYRLRVGDYRVVYAVEDDVLIVLVVRIGHRREVYR